MLFHTALGWMAGLGFAVSKGGAERLAEIFSVLDVVQWELDTWSVSRVPGTQPLKPSESLE